jgi:hypothetical protein
MIDLHRSAWNPGGTPLLAALLGWLVVQNTLLLLEPARFTAAPFVVARALLRVLAAVASQYPLLVALVVMNGVVAVWIGIAAWRRSNLMGTEDLS